MVEALRAASPTFLLLIFHNVLPEVVKCFRKAAGMFHEELLLC